MSADELRRAADGLRGEWSGGAEPMGTAWHRERDFHLAVADWLDNIAERDPTGQSVEAGSALVVARAYLGGAP